MYRTLTYPKRLCGLPHCRIMINDIMCNLHCPLFDIFLHRIPLHSLFLQCMQKNQALFIFVCPVMAGLEYSVSFSLKSCFAQLIHHSRSAIIHSTPFFCNFFCLFFSIRISFDFFQISHPFFISFPVAASFGLFI